LKSEEAGEIAELSRLNPPLLAGGFKHYQGNDLPLSSILNWPQISTLSLSKHPFLDFSQFIRHAIVAMVKRGRYQATAEWEMCDGFSPRSILRKSLAFTGGGGSGSAITITAQSSDEVSSSEVHGGSSSLYANVFVGFYLIPKALKQTI
jgi:hypothetical protein